MPVAVVVVIAALIHGSSIGPKRSEPPLVPFVMLSLTFNRSSIDPSPDSRSVDFITELGDTSSPADPSPFFFTAYPLAKFDGGI
uniref:Putative secreted protein n=1 Tax=Anopheles darlingi TaxID=43151 RepID=A0A2M4DI60_ANODA